MERQWGKKPYANADRLEKQLKTAFRQNDIRCLESRRLSQTIPSPPANLAETLKSARNVAFATCCRVFSIFATRLSTFCNSARIP
jgi:hypothetical protein